MLADTQTRPARGRDATEAIAGRRPRRTGHGGRASECGNSTVSLKSTKTLKSHQKHQERAEEISNYASDCRGVASGRETSGG